ncbi:MAG TPA: cytochrome b N-terminal domain-containing protein [Vicinamibacterales bacterium]|nr:cytochrome b N-terminal domain-containing protein [Vicinamibacterales bacterium]
MSRRILDWLDARIGYRRIARVLLDEPIPAGTGWLFTLGGVLLSLVAVQVLTGAFLTLYYAPTPDHAYESVRFVDGSTTGRVVRGLHYYGASFIVIALALHLLRVVVLGSYKPPREATWLSGLALLGLMLAFALTGYLLPWDQRAYWATVVTINIARLAPVAGDAVAAIVQGGASIGALTLTRWYAAHVIFLPAALLLLVVVHLALMRRHGISGPVRPRDGAALPFYPFHAARDVAVVVVVLGALAAFAWHGAPSLDGPADPTDPTYIPRPEWYFLGLFQLLKYFPGHWEVAGAILLPALAAMMLALLPWIDRGPDRDPRRRPLVIGSALAMVLVLAVLTALGWRDRPATAATRDGWTLREIGGGVMAGAAGCARCHAEAGIADPLDSPSTGRGAEWLTGHVVDPEVIAPGLRQPPLVLNEREIAAIVAYVQRLGRDRYPAMDPRTETAAAVYARHCIGCHVIDGEGGDDGPELTVVGRKHDAATLRRWIADPEAVDPDADMPAFGHRLSAEQLDAIAGYLADRR